MMLMFPFIQYSSSCMGLCTPKVLHVETLQQESCNGNKGQWCLRKTGSSLMFVSPLFIVHLEVFLAISVQKGSNIMTLLRPMEAVFWVPSPKSIIELREYLKLCVCVVVDVIIAWDYHTPQCHSSIIGVNIMYPVIWNHQTVSYPT